MEYRRAKAKGVPRLIFFMHEDHPITAGEVETGDGAARLAALKEEIGKERVAAFFKSPEDLRAQAYQALAELGGRRPAQGGSEPAPEPEAARRPGGWDRQKDDGGARGSEEGQSIRVGSSRVATGLC